MQEPHVRRGMSTRAKRCSQAHVSNNVGVRIPSDPRLRSRARAALSLQRDTKSDLELWNVIELPQFVRMND